MTNAKKVAKTNKNAAAATAPKAVTVRTRATKPKPLIAAVTTTDSPLVAIASVGPTSSAPLTPVGFVRGELGKGGVRPTLGQVSHASQAGAEITNSTTFESDFGSKGTPPAILGENLTRAASWSAEEARATNWLAYVKQGRQAAWDIALAQLEAFQPVFNHAFQSDPTIATSYPNTAALFSDRHLAAKKASATKKRIAKVAAATNGTKTTAPAAPPPVVPNPVPAAVASNHPTLAS